MRSPPLLPKPASSWSRFDLSGTDRQVEGARLRVRPAVAGIARDLAQPRQWRMNHHPELGRQGSVGRDDSGDSRRASGREGRLRPALTLAASPGADVADVEDDALGVILGHHSLRRGRAPVRRAVSSTSRSPSRSAASSSRGTYAYTSRSRSSRAGFSGKLSSLSVAGDVRGSLARTGRVRRGAEHVPQLGQQGRDRVFDDRPDHAVADVQIAVS